MYGKGRRYSKIKKNSHKVWKEHYTRKALEKYSQEKETKGLTSERKKEKSAEKWKVAKDIWKGGRN